jgi:hypothetical protein
MTTTSIVTLLTSLTYQRCRSLHREPSEASQDGSFEGANLAQLLQTIKELRLRARRLHLQDTLTVQGSGFRI